MKKLLVFLFIVTGSVSFAHSNIVGTWINQNQTLSIAIVDNPASPPFTAGEIWKWMRSSGRNKLIKTQNFELRCAGVTQRGNDVGVIGNCKIRVAREKVIQQPTTLNFSLSKNEGKTALKNFIQPPGQQSILIKSGILDEFGKDQFMFEINWRYEMLGALINKTLIFK